MTVIVRFPHKYLPKFEGRELALANTNDLPTRYMRLERGEMVIFRL